MTTRKVPHSNDLLCDHDDEHNKNHQNLQPSRGRMNLRRRYNQRIIKRNNDCGGEDRPMHSRRRRRSATTKFLLDKADDSTESTATLSWISKSRNYPLHSQLDNNDSNSLIEDSSASKQYQHTKANTATTTRRRRQQQDADNLSRGCEDKYAIHDDEDNRNKFHGDDSDGDDDSVKRDISSANDHSFCSIRGACAAATSEGCSYGSNFCPRIATRFQQQQQQQQNTVKSRKMTTSNYKTVDEEANTTSKTTKSDDHENEWDFKVVPIGGPTEAVSFDYVSMGKGEGVQPGTLVELFGKESFRSIAATLSPRLAAVGETKNGLVMSTSSIILREIMRVNLSLSTTISTLQNTLDPKSIVNPQRLQEMQDFLTTMSSMSQLQRLQKHLHRGDKCEAQESNFCENHGCDGDLSWLLPVLGSVRCDSSIEKSAAASSVPPTRRAFGLLLVHAMAMGEKVTNEDRSLLNSDFVFHILQWMYQNGESAPDLRALAHAFTSRPPIDTSKSENQSQCKLPTIAPSETATSESEDGHVDSESLTGYTPPVYIQQFEKELEEATDLTASFFDAHIRTNFIGHHSDDDGLEKEITSLSFIEREIYEELELIVVETSIENCKKRSTKSVLKEDNGAVNTQRASSAMYHAILAMSSDSSSDEDGFTLTASESTFDVQETRNAVFSAIQRIQGHIPVAEYGVQLSLDQVQQKILNDLSQLDSSSMPYTSSLEISEKSEDSLIIEVPMNASSISDMSFDAQLDNLDSEGTKAARKEWLAVLDECDSIPMLSNVSRERKSFSGSGRSSQSEGECSPEMKEYPSLMDTTASSDSMEESLSIHDRYHETTDLGDDSNHPFASANEMPKISNDGDDTVSHSDILNERIRRTIWDSLLGVNPRKSSTLLTEKTMENDLSVQGKFKLPNNLDPVEQGRTTPRKPSLIIGSTSRTAYQQDAYPGLVSQCRRINDKGRKIERLRDVPVPEIHFEDIPHEISDLPLPGGGCYSEPTRIAAPCRTQGETMIDDNKMFSALPNIDDPVWSMSPKLHAFSETSETCAGPGAWSLSPNLTPLESDASIEMKPAKKKDEIAESKQSFTDYGNLLRSSHASMKDKKQPRAHAKDDYDPFEAAEKIPEVFSEARSPISQRKSARIGESKRVPREGMGIEAVLLSNDVQPNPSYISDISGSTDSEYAESNSAEWSRSIASSMWKTSTSGSHSIPFSSLHIGLQSLGTSTDIESSEKEENSHPLKAALKRKPLTPPRRQQQLHTSLLGTISNIGNVMMSPWRCDEPDNKRKLGEKRQGEQQVLERLRGIRHY